MTANPLTLHIRYMPAIDGTAGQTDAVAYREDARGCADYNRMVKRWPWDALDRPAPGDPTVTVWGIVWQVKKEGQL